MKTQPTENFKQKHIFHKKFAPLTKLSYFDHEPFLRLRLLSGHVVREEKCGAGFKGNVFADFEEIKHFSSLSINIARVANALNCHNDCHGFRFTIVNIEHNQ